MAASPARSSYSPSFFPPTSTVSMYAGYGSASPPLTNNPFLPNGIQQVASRFPDISSPSLNNGNGYNGQPQQSWGDGYMTGGGGGYSQQQQQGMYQQYPQQQMQQQPMQTGYGQQGMGGGFFSGGQNYPPQSPPPTGQFQPSTAFGQQLAANISGSSYGYLNGQQQQQGSAYHPAQQQLQNNPNYVAQLDPYASLAQIVEGGGSSNANSYNQPSNYGNSNNGMAQSLSTGSTMSSTSSFSSSSSGASFGVGPAGDAHPKDFIRTHKAELEKWDNYAWRQLLNSFEAMKRAWEGRKTELTSKAKEIISKGQMGMAYGYYAQQIQQEASTIQELLKEAESNFGSVAASTFQMQEVFQGYRQSGDIASKRRVREATNAALQGLPGWPQPYQ